MAQIKPTVISTFAGCGGSSLGYHMAGFEELLAVEWDDNAVVTFKLNFPTVPIYHGDIGKLTSEECMKLANIKKGELDVFDGSPPCQGFSTSGQRKLNDPRNTLFKEYARLIYDLQPKVFVMENVTGMIKGHMKQSYLQIIKTLRDCGYKAKGQVLNAMYYGVAQSRERIIIIGVREDLGIEPSHPKPFCKPIFAIDAIKGCSDKPRLHNSERTKAIWQRIKPGENGSDSCEQHKNGFSLKKLHPYAPCRTISKGWTAGSGLMHWDEPRFLSIPELKRLASFPDDFIFTENPINAINRIGNCVPPLLMRAIALHIKNNILTNT